ncbi:MAG: hypothetical protein JOZ86_02695 [Candidatus Eremiobacteraeota bacterium]|nr:hypothetical protein [Candidatus Eremiobacteraeota bacterium]
MEAYVTVTDAAGRVLFRRPATAEEIAEALRAADNAERGARAVLAEIAAERGMLPPSASSEQRAS